MWTEQVLVRHAVRHQKAGSVVKEVKIVVMKYKDGELVKWLMYLGFVLHVAGCSQGLIRQSVVKEHQRVHGYCHHAVQKMKLLCAVCYLMVNGNAVQLMMVTVAMNKEHENLQSM